MTSTVLECPLRHLCPHYCPKKHYMNSLKTVKADGMVVLRHYFYYLKRGPAAGLPPYTVIGKVHLVEA